VSTTARALRRRGWRRPSPLRTLLARVTELDLAVPVDSLEWIPPGIMRDVLSLPVRYRIG